MMLLRDRVHVQHDLVPVLPEVEPVHAAEIEEELEVELGMVAQEPHRLDPRPAVDGDGEVAPEIVHPQDPAAQALGEDAGRGVSAADGRGRRRSRQFGSASHARCPRACRAAPVLLWRQENPRRS